MGTKRRVLFLLIAVVSAILGANGAIGGGGPMLTVQLPPGTVLHQGQVLEFTVQATYPWVADVRISLLDPPAGCVFTQDSPGTKTAAGNSATGKVRWLVPSGLGYTWGQSNVGGLHHLTFRASDTIHPGHALFASVDVRVDGMSTNTPILFADVTGDGVVDTVAGAALANGPLKRHTDTGAVYVWMGTAAPTGSPDATLQPSSPTSKDLLGLANGQGIQLADVTGDGILDVVVGAFQADVAGVFDAGAIYVWEGGPTLRGTPAVHATLTVSGAVASDHLGGGNPYSPIFSDIFGQGIQLADVTGDGVVDVVAAAVYANVASVIDSGAVYVWEGGAALNGTPAPRATLAVAGAANNDRLGDLSGQGVEFADVTTDGILDLVVGNQRADIAGVADVGAIYVWEGGASLIGSPAPRATLSIAGAVVLDWLGAAAGQAMQVADVTGDGAPDVVASAVYADIAGTQDAGAIYVWQGGAALIGSPAPFATLTVSGAAVRDWLGIAGGQGVQLADVTADGVLDVVAGASYADVAGVTDAGAIFVWKGGATLRGSPLPLATLTVPGANACDELGIVGYSEQGIQIADVTGDGALDVVSGASLADVAGTADVGAIYVWKGGSTLGGSPAPTATLTVPGAVSGERLGSSAEDGQGIQLADVTGDGCPDIVAATSAASVGGVVGAGAVYVWKGGPSLIGSPATRATLVVAGATAGDQLGRAGGQGVHVADVTGDGVLDLVAGAMRADIAGVVDAGAVYLWEGGTTLAGLPAPRATLTVPGVLAGAQLGFAGGEAIRIGDVTGDQRLDVVVGASFASASTTSSGGAVYVWKGGTSLRGLQLPTATLSVAGTVAGGLGYLPEPGGTNDYAQGVHLADVTGDGVLEVVAGSNRADISGVTDTGAIYAWRGGPTLVSSPALLSAFTVPGAKAYDQLGY